MLLLIGEEANANTSRRLTNAHPIRVEQCDPRDPREPWCTISKFNTCLDSRSKCRRMLVLLR
jgi:hypothetical protein